MIRFYANQAGYLPKGRKIAVLAQENRADEMEKMKDKKVSLWNKQYPISSPTYRIIFSIDTVPYPLHLPCFYLNP